MNRSVPKSANAQRTGFPAEDVRNYVCGDVRFGYAFAFALSNGQLVEVNLLNFDSVFSESDELQELGAILLTVCEGSADPGFDVFRNGSPR